jgi:protein TonB
MLHLVESARLPRPRRAPWTAASTALHAALIAAAALAGTREVAHRLPEAPPDPIIFTTVARSTAPAALALPGSPGSLVARPELRVPDVVIPLVSNLLDNFARVPPVPLQGGDVTQLSGVVPARTLGPDRVYDHHTVDRAVAPRAGNPSPEFPQVLRSAGVSGEVLARFVVDTNGRVEPGSVAITSASHSLFADAVRRWLPRTRYEPARAGSARVRQVVEQRIEFALMR